MRSRIVVNGGWRGQRVTGQQRYARKITERVAAASCVEVRPEGVPTNKYLAWTTVQALAIPHRRDETLLTLTSRGPLWHPRHVVVVHDHFVITHPEWYSTSYARTHAPILKAQIAGAKALVFVSEATRERHIGMFGLKVPNVVVPNGISEEMLHCTAVEPLVDCPYFLVVGSQDPRKNIARLVAAFLSLPSDLRNEARLVIAGGGNSAVFAETCGNFTGGHVTQLGYVTDEELWTLYRHALAVVVPSLDEGFGLPLVEASALGTDLIVSDIPVFRWIAGDHARYFDPLDIDSIATELARHLRDGGPGPVRDVTARFSWDRSATALLGFLYDLNLAS